MIENSAGHGEYVGQQFGNYRLIRLLGRGGFADVYLGEHLLLKTQAALKVLRIQFTDNALEDFLNEARTIAHLEHPHIVRVLECGVERRIPFLVMYYAPNGTLRRLYPKGSRVRPDEVLPYAQQIASALDYAHREKLIHRDIKPENLLLDRNSEVLVSDFGLVIIAQTTGSQSTKIVAGTVPYMAPEQLRGRARPESDQYALGIVIYEWLSGERPFKGTFTEIASQHLLATPPPLYGRVPDVSLAIERVVFRALEKDPHCRFASVQEFASTLAQACTAGQHTVFTPPFTPALPDELTQSTNRMKRPGLPSKSVKANMPTYGLSSSTYITGNPSNPQPPPIDVSSQSSQTPKGRTVSLSSPSSFVPMTPPDWSQQTTAPDIQLFGISTRTIDTVSQPSQSQETVISSPASHFDRKGISRRTIIAGLVSLGAMGGGLTFIFSHGSSAVQPKSQPTTMPGSTPTHKSDPTATHVKATPIASPDPSPTATTAFNAYNTAIATNGIMFGFDLQHTHLNPYEKILSPTNVSMLVRDWTFQTGGYIESSPAVANGVIYIGSDDNNFYALDARTGSKLWAFQTRDAIYSSPAVANGVIYIGSWDHTLYALDARTGSKLWTFQAGGPVSSSPTVVNGVVYVGSDDSNLYALNARTGSKLWAFQAGNVIYSSPAVANGVVYVGSRDHMFYALNASTGSKLWAFQTGRDVTSSPAVSNGVVYVGSYDRMLYALDARTGNKLWTFQTGDAIYSSPAVSNVVVYVGSYDHMLYALNAGTGGKLWAFQTGDAIYSSPAVANGVVYVGSEDDNLYALDARTGNKLWAFQAIGSVTSSPAVANGVVYVGSWDHTFYAFHLPG